MAKSYSLTFEHRVPCERPPSLTIGYNTKTVIDSKTNVPVKIERDASGGSVFIKVSFERFETIEIAAPTGFAFVAMTNFDTDKQTAESLKFLPHVKSIKDKNGRDVHTTILTSDDLAEKNTETYLVDVSTIEKCMEIMKLAKWDLPEDGNINALKTMKRSNSKAISEILKTVVFSKVDALDDSQTQFVQHLCVAINTYITVQDALKQLTTISGLVIPHLSVGPVKDEKALPIVSFKVYVMQNSESEETKKENKPENKSDDDFDEEY